MEVFLKIVPVVVFIGIDYYIFPRIFKLLFPRKGDFLETVRVGFRPDIISLFKGEYWKDQGCELMISILMFMYGGIVLLEFFAGKYFLTLFGF